MKCPAGPWWERGLVAEPPEAAAAPLPYRNLLRGFKSTSPAHKIHCLPPLPPGPHTNPRLTDPHCPQPLGDAAGRTAGSRRQSAPPAAAPVAARRRPPAAFWGAAGPGRGGNGGRKSLDMQTAWSTGPTQGPGSLEHAIHLEKPVSVLRQYEAGGKIASLGLCVFNFGVLKRFWEACWGAWLWRRSGRGVGQQRRRPRRRQSAPPQARPADPGAGRIRGTPPRWRHLPPPPLEGLLLSG